MAIKLNVEPSTFFRRLHVIGKINKEGRWVPHMLTGYNVNQSINTCISLLAKYNKKDFLLIVVTWDEKWVDLENYTNKKQWLSPV